MKRTTTGILLIALVVALVLFGSPYLLVAVELAVALVGVWEFYRLAESAGFRVLRQPGYAFAIGLSILTLLGYVRVMTPFVLGILFGMLLMVGAMATTQSVQNYLGAVSCSFFGPIYVALPLTMLVWVWLDYDGPFHVLFALVVIWGGDTAGYFIGKKFGKHRSSPRISPNKTWEGTIASFIAALLVGLITSRYFWSGGYFEPILLAAALNIAGQFGDLAESALKRSAGVKDSSNLIPGHGGVLDRIDALLFAAPILWYYWLWRAG